MIEEVPEVLALEESRVQRPLPPGRFTATIELSFTHVAMWGSPGIMAGSLKGTLENILEREFVAEAVALGAIKDWKIEVETTGLEIINAQG